MRKYAAYIILTIITCLTVGCGGESRNTNNNDSTKNPSTAQPNVPSDNETPDSLEKLITVFVPNFVSGTVHISQSNLQFDWQEDFLFIPTTPNTDRFVEVTIPNKLFTYDVWVEEAVYDDTATNNNLNFTNTTVMNSIIPASYAENQVSVTVYTHLAKKAYDFYNSNVTWDSIDSAYREYLGIGSFLSLIPRHTGIVYNPSIPDDVRYGMWISAFSRLAEIHEDFQDDVYNDGTSLDMKSLLTNITEEDVGFNGVFSGNGTHDSVKIHNQTMRLHLAQGLYQYLGSSHNTTNYNQSQMLALNIANSVTLCDNPVIFDGSYSPLHTFTENVTKNCIITSSGIPTMISAAHDITFDCEAISDVGIYVFRGFAYFENINNGNVTTVKLHSTTYNGIDEEESNSDNNIYQFNKFINLAPYAPTLPDPFEYTMSTDYFIYDNALNKIDGILTIPSFIVP